MNHLLFCPSCNSVILKSAGGEVKVRSKILVLRDGVAHAVCRGCNSEVPVPLSVDQPLLKSMVANPKLYITGDS